MAKSTAFARIKQDILTLTGCIPPGRVCTYGAIADHLDVMPRQVAYILATLRPPDREVVPWHRVVANHGAISLANAARAALQHQALQSEGIRFVNPRQIQDFDAHWIATDDLGSGVPRQRRPD